MSAIPLLELEIHFRPTLERTARGWLIHCPFHGVAPQPIRSEVEASRQRWAHELADLEHPDRRRIWPRWMDA